MSPGWQVVRFKETINHEGAPFRIALTIGGSDSRYSDFVLLDHIPHNDASSTTPKEYLVAVQIPDIACDHCALQLIQVMTDKFDFPCANPDGLATSCGNPSYAYFSCANIQISGHEDPAKLKPFYNDYWSAPADSRLPYAREGSVSVWTPTPGSLPSANSWTLVQSNGTTSSATSATSTSKTQPATTQPSQVLQLWQKWMIPIIIVGVILAIAIITGCFLCWRKRHRARMAADQLPRVGAYNFETLDAFDDDDEDAFDDTF